MMHKSPVSVFRAATQAAILLLVGRASCLAAQGQSFIAPHVFLDRAYFAPATPTNKNLIFEGAPTAHYFFWNTLSDEHWQKIGGWKFTVPVSEMFVVRMTDTTSSPVLTPSFRIGIRPQALDLVRRTPHSRRFALWGFSGGVTHYSNGQHGCRYRGYTQAPNGGCDTSDLALARQEIANTEDGDFSTTYLSLAAHYRRGLLPDLDSKVLCQVNATVEYQEHPIGFHPGGTDLDQARHFGRREIDLLLEFERRLSRGDWTGVLRLAGAYQTRFGGGVPVPLKAGYFEASYVLDRVENVGLFARQHWGFDYYNIQFQNRRPFFTVGFLWDVSRLDHLNSDFENTKKPKPPEANCRL
jgi:hypothetical protein